jgi:hypothetical protein
MTLNVGGEVIMEVGEDLIKLAELRAMAETLEDKTAFGLLDGALKEAVVGINKQMPEGIKIVDAVVRGEIESVGG